jgi:hypothetical protein
MSANAPAISVPVGPPTDNHEIQCALPHQRRVAIGVLENGQDARAQALGFFYGVERKGVLLGAFGAEKVRL